MAHFPWLSRDLFPRRGADPGRRGDRLRGSSPRPAGALVYSRGAVDHETIPTEGSGDLTVRFPAAQDGPPPRLAVVTPAGRGYEAAWSVGRVIGAAPPVRAAGSSAFLAGAAMIRGTSAPDALLSVDGREVRVGSDGAFSTRVDAGLWPRSVSVSCVDPWADQQRDAERGGLFRLPEAALASDREPLRCLRWPRSRAGVSGRAPAWCAPTPWSRWSRRRAATALMDGRLPDTLQAQTIASLGRSADWLVGGRLHPRRQAPDKAGQRRRHTDRAREGERERRRSEVKEHTSGRQ